MFTETDLAPMFELLEQCRGVPQMEIHHPEGDVLNHSLQVMEWAFRESDSLDLIFAALFHDVGKTVVRKGHESESAKMMRPHATAKTLWLIENHMRFWYFVLGDMKKLSKVKSMHVPWLGDLALLCRWDKLGRNPNKIVTFDRGKIVERLNRCVSKQYDFSELAGKEG
jgi:hypothetical protein